MAYAIHADYHFYAGTLYGSKPGLLRSWDGPLIVLRTRGDADLLVEMLGGYGDGYVLAHGQYAVPSFEPVEYTGRAEPMSLRQAMRLCDMDYDSHPDGTRIELTEAEMFGA